MKCPNCGKELTERGSCSITVRSEITFLDCHFDPDATGMRDNGEVSYDIRGLFLIESGRIGDDFYELVSLVTCHGCQKTFTPNKTEYEEEGLNPSSSCGSSATPKITA